MPNPVDPSWTSLLPAAVTVALAFSTRQVLLALVAGIATASVVLFAQTRAPEDLNFIRRFVLPELGSQGFAPVLLIYLLCLGGILGTWTKTGAALLFARRLGQRCAGDSRSALLLAWLLGVIFHQGGTVTTVITATTAKPVADPQRVSHEELAYVVDSTTTPAATLIPLNVWPVAIGAMLAGTIAQIPSTDAGMSWFLSSIPFNFYAIFALCFTLLFAFGMLPFVGRAMRAAIARARTTGALDGPDASPVLGVDVEPSVGTPGYEPTAGEFWVPVLVLASVTGAPFLLSALVRSGAIAVGGAAGAMLEAVGSGQWMFEGFSLALLAAVGIPLARGLPLSDALDGVVAGCRSMTSGALLLALALVLAAVSRELRGAAYLAQLVGDAVPLVALPALLMFACSALAFASGTWWGTYAVALPVAIPLAYQLHPDPGFLHICFGAVIGGAIYGDQCSPISDSTILAAMFSGADVMDHVRTQIPLATAAALLAGLSSTAAAALSLALAQ